MQKFLTDVKVIGNIETTGTIKTASPLQIGDVLYKPVAGASGEAFIATTSWVPAANHTFTGTNTFSNPVTVANATADTHAATLAQVNNAASTAAAGALDDAKGYTDAEVKKVSDALAGVSVEKGTGINVTADGKKFTVAVDTETIATVAAAESAASTAAAGALEDAKGYTDQQVAALTAADGAITTLAGRVTTAEGEIDDLQTDLNTLDGSVVKNIAGDESNDFVKVKAGALTNGKVELSVETSDIASATDLTALETKVNTHIADAAKISIVVAEADAEGKPAVTDPVGGKIYLVEDTDGQSGTYVEWIYIVTAEDAEGKPTAGTWERIGTTATDLTEYAKAADVADTYVAKSTLAKNTISGAGITVSQEAGNVTAVSVTSGTIAANDSSVVTGATVHTAIEGVKTDVITPLAERVTTAEGEIDALQLATGTTLPGQISQVLEDAKDYADDLVDGVSVVEGTGIDVSANGKAFTVSVDTATIATVQSVTDAVGAAKTEITGVTNALDERIDNLETQATAATKQTFVNGVGTAGNFSSNAWTITHTLNDKDVSVTVTEVETGTICYPEVVISGPTTVVIKVSAAVPQEANTYKVVIQK